MKDRFSCLCFAFANDPIVCLFVDDYRLTIGFLIYNDRLPSECGSG